MEEKNSCNKNEVQPEEEEIQEEEQMQQPEDERKNIQSENEQKLKRGQFDKERPTREQHKPAYLSNYLSY